MSERAKTVGNNKGSPRSELVVSQQNTAANNIKRSRISKKADSVSSLSGINKKWNQIENTGMSANSSDNINSNSTNTNGANRESDHDYGFAPSKNGHNSHDNPDNGQENNTSSIEDDTFDDEVNEINATEVVEFDDHVKQIIDDRTVENNAAIKDEEVNGRDQQTSLNISSNGKTEVRSEQVEPTPDEHQVISFLDSLLANKKNMQQQAAPFTNNRNETQFIKSEYDASDVASNGGQASKTDNFDSLKPKAIYGVVGIHGVKKEVATVAGIPQDKPNSSIENNKNGASMTSINGSIISTTLKPSNGTSINCQVATHTNGQKQFGRPQPLVLPISGNGISSTTTISGIRTISNGSIGNNGTTNGPNVIVVNSNQLRSLFPNATHTNLSTTNITQMNNENGSSSTNGSTAQILQIRQNNGQINVQNSITDVHQHQQKRSIQARFIDGEFSQSTEQTDLKINDVVGLELFVETMEGGRSTRDISHPPLYGTVDIYLVHSHDLFLRDTIDAKGHQGVKGDTNDMKDFPLRAWVLNGSQEYKIKQTKVHGDVRAVNVTLQGENKVHLLFTVLSTDQRNFGRNHKAKLWSLEVVGELNNIPVKISLPTQVVACLRNPLRLKRSKRRADSTNHRPHLKQVKTEAKSPVPGEGNDISPYDGNVSLVNGGINIRASATENSAYNGASPTIDSNGTAYLRSTSNGHAGIDINDSGLSLSSNGDVSISEKSALIEELIQTLRETYERMPSHLIQYELAKAKAMSVIKYT